METCARVLEKELTRPTLSLGEMIDRLSRAPTQLLLAPCISRRKKARLGTSLTASNRKEDMARPKLHSDEFILNTALSVLLQKGPSAFTLSDVAEAVGISRAALIQRFKDKATLHRKVMERITEEVRDYFAKANPAKGLDPLWTLLKELISGMGSGAGMEGYLLLLWGDVQDPPLRLLAAERNRLVLKAIEVRLPAGPRPPKSTAALIQTVIQGACMQWLVEPDDELAAFMTERTRMLLSILYPDHVFK